MTNGDEYGDDTVGGIILTTAVTGSVGSETPNVASGETVYLICEKLGGRDGFLQKIKECAGGITNASRDGKKGIDLTIQNCVIFKWSNSGHVTNASNTVAFNLIRDWIHSKHDAGDAPFYLFAYNFVDTAYIRLTPNSYRYLKGFVKEIDWEIAKGNIYYFKSLTWKWVT